MREFQQIRDRVFTALDNALSNGYDTVQTDDPVQVAADLAEFDADLETAPAVDLVLAVKAWQTNQREMDAYVPGPDDPLPSTGRRYHIVTDFYITAPNSADAADVLGEFLSAGHRAVERAHQTRQLGFVLDPDVQTTTEEPEEEPDVTI